MIDDGPMGCLFGWPPRGTWRRWLTALGAVALLLGAFYVLFSMLLGF